MAKVLDELLMIRRHFEEGDREDAMNVLMRRIYYEIAPRVTSGDTFTLFRNENDMTGFCHSNNLDMRGLSSVLDMMRKEGLIMQDAFPVVLTQLGVEKLCR